LTSLSLGQHSKTSVGYFPVLPSLSVSKLLIFLKVKQYQVLASLLEKRDTVAILPTGYGKSIIIHLYPFDYDHITVSPMSHGHGCAVLIVTPLNSFIISMTKLLDADWLRGVQIFH
jgi:hypothetical protein